MKHIFIRIGRWKNVYQMGTKSHEISPGSGSVGAVTFWTSFIHGSVVICKDPDPSLFFSIEKTWFLSKSLKTCKQRVKSAKFRTRAKARRIRITEHWNNYNIQYRSGKIRYILKNSYTFICIALQSVLRIRDIYPGTGILDPDFTHPGSKNSNKREGWKKFAVKFNLKAQVSQNWKLIYFWNAEEENLGQFSKNCTIRIYFTCSLM